MTRAPVIIRGVTYDSNRAAADALGVSVSCIRAARCRGRLDAVGLPRLHMSAMLYALPDDVRDWLVAQVPEGTTIGEYVRAIIIDAYHDEVGA